MNHIAVHISQPMIASLVSIGELFVINTQTMKNGGMQIVNLHSIFDGLITELIGGTVDDPGLDSSSGHPH